VVERIGVRAGSNYMHPQLLLLPWVHFTKKQIWNGMGTIVTDWGGTIAAIKRGMPQFVLFMFVYSLVPLYYY
jgi:hypothetical protein